MKNRQCWTLLCRIACLISGSLGFLSADAQTTNFLLGRTNLFIGPASGTNSVVLGSPATTNRWTASAVDSWLHVVPAYQSGVGSTNIIFTFDANNGPTRSGAIAIANQTLEVTQAGSNYVPCSTPTVLVSSGMQYPAAVALDNVGNAYIADAPSNCIRQWTMTNNTLSTPITGISYPIDLAFDRSNNLIIGSQGSGVFRWNPTTKALFHYTAIPAGFQMTGVGIDWSNNVYVVQSYPGNEVIEYPPTYPQKSSITFGNINEPTGARIDVGGTIFVSGQTGAPGLIEINPFTKATNNLASGPTSVGTVYAFTLALDGGDNVFIAASSGLVEWSAATQDFTIPLTPTNTYLVGIAVDSAGDLFYTTGNGTNATLWELPNAFFDPTAKLEGTSAGTDSLSAPVPANVNMLPPFAPASSDTSWLTISGVTNGVVNFAFTENPGPARTAYISLFGLSIPVTQGLIGTPPVLGAVQTNSNGTIQFSFTNTPGASFTVLAGTDLTTPLSGWSVVGHAAEVSPGHFQYGSIATNTSGACFYTVRSP